MSRVNKTDARKFYELQEPHADAEVLNAAIEKFLDEVGESRERHRIAEVMTVCSVRYLDSKGEEAEAIVQHFYGDMLHAEGIAAYAFGRYSQLRQEHVGSLLNQSKTLKTPKPKGEAQDAAK